MAPNNQTHFLFLLPAYRGLASEHGNSITILSSIMLQHSFNLRRGDDDNKRFLKTSRIRRNILAWMTYVNDFWMATLVHIDVVVQSLLTVPVNMGINSSNVIIICAASSLL